MEYMKFILKPNIYGYEANTTEFKIHTYLTAPGYSMECPEWDKDKLFNVQYLSISIFTHDLSDIDYDKAYETAKEVLKFWCEEYGFEYSMIGADLYNGLCRCFQGILGMPIDKEFPDLKHMFRRQREELYK